MTPLVDKKLLKHSPVVLGIAVTKFKAATNEHQNGLQILQMIISEFQNHDHLLVDAKTAVFSDQPIKEFVVHAEAVQDSLPLCFYAPGSQAYSDVRAFTQRFLKAIKDRQ